MNRKSLAALLTAAMLLCLFSGCSGGAPAASTTAAATAAGTTAAGTTAASTTAASATTASAATTAAAAEEPSLFHALGELPLVTSPVTLTVGIVDHATVGEYSENVLWNHIQERTGVTLDYVQYPPDEYNTKVDLMMAAGGNDLPELLISNNISTTARNTWGANGFTIDLLPYLDANTYWTPKNFADNVETITWEEVIRGCSAPDGSLYTFPGYVENYLATNNCRLYLNLDWLEKAGMLRYDGNGELMTSLDELVSYFELVKTGDYNGNGLNDEIPLTASGTTYITRDFLPAFLGMGAENDFYIDTAADAVCFNYNRDEYREALRFIHMLVEKEYLDPLAFTQDLTSMKATLQLEPTVVGSWAYANNAGVDAAEDFPYDYVCGLSAPGSSERYLCSIAGYTFCQYIVTQNCENVELAVRLADYWGSEEINLMTAKGEEGVEWDWLDNARVDKSSIVRPYGDAYQDKAVYAYTKDEGNRYAGQPVDNVTLRGHGVYVFPNYFNACNVITQEKYDANPNLYKRVILYNDKSIFPTDSILRNMVYTEEEAEIRTDLWAPIETYVDECFTRFCLGDMSVETDWDRYIGELEKMGIQDVIEVMNTCYSRMYK